MNNRQGGSLNFFAPISVQNKKLIWLWVSVFSLLILKIYPGDHSFYIDHINRDLQPGPLLDWLQWLYHNLSTLILFGIVPLLIILSFKEDPANYGLKPGDWRFGLKATIITFIILPLPVYLASSGENFRAHYPLTTLANQSAGLFGLWALSYLPHYLGWEFFFRGFIGFGFKKSLGLFNAIMLQTLITTLMHIGKPLPETIGAAFGGVYLGLLTYRTGSVLWAIFFHWYLGLLATYFGGL